MEIILLSLYRRAVRNRANDGGVLGGRACSTCRARGARRVHLCRMELRARLRLVVQTGLILRTLCCCCPISYVCSLPRFLHSRSVAFENEFRIHVLYSFVIFFNFVFYANPHSLCIRFVALDIPLFYESLHFSPLVSSVTPISFNLVALNF